MTIGIDIGGTNIKSVSLRDGGIISSHSVRRRKDLKASP